MNVYTQDIAYLLQVDIETASAVQSLMELEDFDFSEEPFFQFAKAARRAYQIFLLG